LSAVGFSPIGSTNGLTRDRAALLGWRRDHRSDQPSPASFAAKARERAHGRDDSHLPEHGARGPTTRAAHAARGREGREVRVIRCAADAA